MAARFHGRRQQEPRARVGGERRADVGAGVRARGHVGQVAHTADFAAGFCSRAAQGIATGIALQLVNPATP